MLHRSGGDGAIGVGIPPAAMAPIAAAPSVPSAERLALSPIAAGPSALSPAQKALLPIAADPGPAQQSLSKEERDAKALQYPEGGWEPKYTGEAMAMGPKALEAEAAIKAMPSGKFKLVWPVPGVPSINDKAGRTGDGRFGWPRKGSDNSPKKHNGWDISAEVGTPVRASAAGKVIILPPDPNGYGSQVIIDHGNGFFTQYAHLGGELVQRSDGVNAGRWTLMFSGMNGRPRQLRTGDIVGTGDQIGVVGRSGNVPDGARSHVHYEVRFGNDGRSLDDRTVIHPGYFLPLP